MKVRFYQTKSGKEPVKTYLLKLPKHEAAFIVAALASIEANGLQGSDVEARQIDRKLWELKFSATRIFYVVIQGPELVLLHAYRKQSQKAPRKELRTAKARMKEVLKS